MHDMTQREVLAICPLQISSLAGLVDCLGAQRQRKDNNKLNNWSNSNFPVKSIQKEPNFFEFGLKNQYTNPFRLYPCFMNLADIQMWRVTHAMVGCYIRVPVSVFTIKLQFNADMPDTSFIWLISTGQSGGIV